MLDPIKSGAEALKAINAAVKTALDAVYRFRDRRSARREQKWAGPRAGRRPSRADHPTWSANPTGRIERCPDARIKLYHRKALRPEPRMNGYTW
jgi:hypothetical protein